MPTPDPTNPTILPFYDSHKRSPLFRVAPYNSVLPLLFKRPNTDTFFPVYPFTGYWRVATLDALNHAPATAYTFVVPLEAAIRIIYEGMWEWQAATHPSWLELIVSQLITFIIELGEDFIKLIFLPGAPLVLLGQRIYALLETYSMNTNVGELFDRMRNRMLANTLTEASYLDRLTNWRRPKPLTRS